MTRIAAIAFSLMLVSATAAAKGYDWGDPSPAPLPAAATRAKTPATAGTFGLGVLVGSDSGLSAKYRLQPHGSVDAAAAWFGPVIEAHSDYLYEGSPLLVKPKVSLGWYAGAGGRVLLVSQNGSASGGVAFAATSAPKMKKGGNGGATGTSGGGGTTVITSNGGATNVGLAARVPVGVELRFPRVPRLEVFGEAALGVGIVNERGAGIGGAVGARWFF